MYKRQVINSLFTGVRVLLLLEDDTIVVGAGDGTLEIVEERSVDQEIFNQKGKTKLINPSLPMLSVVWIFLYMCVFILNLNNKIQEIIEFGIVCICLHLYKAKLLISMFVSVLNKLILRINEYQRTFFL